MDFRTMTEDQIVDAIKRLTASTMAIDAKGHQASEEEKAKRTVQSRLIAAARLELSRREASQNSLPF